MSSPALLNVGNLCFAVAPFGIAPTTKSGNDNRKFAKNNGHTPKGVGNKMAIVNGNGASTTRTATRPQKGPQTDGGCLGTALDVSGYVDAIFWKDFSAFPAISLRQWTFLDVLERY